MGATTGTAILAGRYYGLVDERNYCVIGFILFGSSGSDNISIITDGHAHARHKYLNGTRVTNLTITRPVSWTFGVYKAITI